MKLHTLIRLVFFSLLLLIAYNYRSEINAKVRGGINYYLPCTLPITYSIGTFDTRFGVGKWELLADMARAEKTWEGVARKELFRYVETGGVLTLNLIYDNRQATTEKLQKIDGVISDKKTTYDTLKSSYTTLTQKLTTQKIQYGQALSELETMKQTFQKEVDYWNRRGGAPAGEYDKLQTEQKNINARVDTLNKKLSEINATIRSINDLATRINTLIDELHLNVAKYNTTRTENGDEFSEGEYVRDMSGERINIYEFSSDTKLFRVLVHELGHALGLQHVDDKDAIMYRLNSDQSEKLTSADKAELMRVCRIGK